MQTNSIIWYQQLNNSLKKYIIDIVYNLYSNLNDKKNDKPKLNNIIEDISKYTYKIMLDKKIGIFTYNEISNEKLKNKIIEHKFDFGININGKNNIDIFNEFNKNIYIISLTSDNDINEKLNIINLFIDILNKSSIKISYNTVEQLNNLKNIINKDINIIIDNFENDLHNISDKTSNNDNISIFSSITSNNNKSKISSDEYFDDTDKLINDTKKLLKKI